MRFTSSFAGSETVTNQIIQGVKAQVAILSIDRDAKRLKEGDRVMFAIDGDRVELHRVDEDVIAASAGLWHDPNESGTEYERRKRQEWIGRL